MTAITTKTITRYRYNKDRFLSSAEKDGWLVLQRKPLIKPTVSYLYTEIEFTLFKKDE